jgi:hypothetical protein
MTNRIATAVATLPTKVGDEAGRNEDKSTPNLDTP